MRALILAEACNPEWTSVPLVGWSWVRAVAEHADVSVATHVRNLEALRRAAPPFEIAAIDNEWIAAPMYRLGAALRGGESLGYTTAMAVSYLPYIEFERRVWKRFGAGIRGGRFDLVHRITPLSPTLPSALAGRCRKTRVPFVLGPLNGGLPWPKSFPGLRRAEREWLSPLRSAYRLLPFHRSTYASNTYPIAASLHTLREVERLGRPCAYLPENGLDTTCFHPPDAPRPPPPPLRIAWVGRMVPYKVPDLVLEAAEGIRDEVDWRLDLVGDGPMREGLARWAADRGLAGRVELHGWLPHAQLAELLRAVHVLCFPSLREFGGAVVAEAMGCGAVPIVAAYGGPAEIVTRESGFRLPISDRARLLGEAARTLQRLARDPDLLQRMSTAAAERAVCFGWERKGEAMLRVYEAVLRDHRDGDGWPPQAFPPLDLQPDESPA